MLVAVHPFFIKLSTTTFIECSYFAFLLAGIYLVLRSFDQPSIKTWCILGGAFGLAYLLRQEAIVTLAAAIVIGVALGSGTRRTKSVRVIAAAVVFSVILTPYVAFLHRVTGQFMLEGKSRFNLAYGKLILEGLSPNEADFSINKNLEGTGVWMRPMLDTLLETRPDVMTVAQVITKAARQNAPILLGRLSDDWLGGPVLFGLAILGIFHQPWGEKKASAHLFVLISAAGSLVGPLFFPNRSVRYSFVAVVFLMIWAGCGLVQVFHWTKINANRLIAGNLSGTLCGILLAGFFTAVILFSSFRSVDYLAEFQESAPHNIPLKQAGLWIRKQQDYPVMIMDFAANVAFHAGGRWIHFPYTTAGLALRFLDAAKVDYVVLREKGNSWAYYQDWFKNGIPNARAELVYVSSDPSPDTGRFKVFRWHHT
jgi:hypothetical protein